jgi:hypothetical protein
VENTEAKAAKNFVILEHGLWRCRNPRAREKSFFASFCSQKEVLALLA